MAHQYSIQIPDKENPII